MIKAVLIDDERKLLEVLKFKLNQHCPQVEIVGAFTSLDHAIEAINSQEVDLVFLDISMKGESGFDLFDRIDEIRFEVIFITGFSEYAIQALKLSAVDYILKPVDNQELKNAVSKAEKRISEKNKVDNIDLLKHNLENNNNQTAKIAIPGSHAYKFVPVSDVIRFEGWDKYTKVFIKDAETIVSSYNLGYYGDLVKNYEFYKSHRSHIINQNHIVEFGSDGMIVMTNGDQVPVSRRKRSDFLNRFIRN